jgi:hypothetical protein
MVEITEIMAPEGIEVKRPLFLLSSEPCCSFTASPFRARVSGKILNRKERETPLKVRVDLLDKTGSVLSSFYDTLVLDEGAEGFFDVKIDELPKALSSYRIEVKEVKEEELFLTE